MLLAFYRKKSSYQVLRHVEISLFEHDKINLFGLET